jgi:hypothetical protein
MNLSKYYNNAKRIGKLVEERDPSILNALNYSEEDDHPSCWVPNVQKSLLGFYKMFPNVVEAEEVLKLYIKGEILEDRAERNLTVKVGTSCLIIGIVLGWFVWA